jgi:hypothetical protein
MAKAAIFLRRRYAVHGELLFLADAEAGALLRPDAANTL